MNLPEKVNQSSELPKKFITGSGVEVNTLENIWTIPNTSGIRYLNFDSNKSEISSQLIYSFKLIVMYYLQYKSTHHAANMFGRFIHFIRTTAENQTICVIRVSDLLSYKSVLGNKDEYWLGSLREFFLTWYELGYPGVDEEVPRFLKGLRLKGNRKGNAVRTMDPEHGPFTDQEVQSLYTAASGGFSHGEITLQQYVLILLFLALGARPSQYASLKLSDLEISRASDGTANYVLQVPRAKQRETRHRGQFRPVRLDPDVGQLLETLARDVRLEAEALAAEETIAPVQATGILPFFPRWNAETPEGFEHHATGDRLAKKLKKVERTLDLISPRTGERLKLVPTRFRRTLGTRAAQEGHGPLIIAALLDHDDTQNVGVYVEATPKIAERINKAMALELAPLAQTFCGLLVEHERQAARGDDRASRVRSNVNPMAFVGNCGKHGFCGGMAPISCYTCQLFQSWLDGPHEEILDALLADRNWILDETGDERMAAVNDATIYAVGHVVELCQARKAELDQ